MCEWQTAAKKLNMASVVEPSDLWGGADPAKRE